MRRRRMKARQIRHRRESKRSRRLNNEVQKGENKTTKKR